MMTDLTGSIFKPLLQDSFHNLSPSVNPDGNRIAYTSDISGNYDIWLMTLSGAKKRRLTHFNGLDVDPRWSPGGEEILFVSTRDGKTGIWKMSIDRVKALRVTRKGILAKF